MSEASKDADSFGVKGTKAVNASNPVISSASANRTYYRYYVAFPSMLAAAYDCRAHRTRHKVKINEKKKKKLGANSASSSTNELSKLARLPGFFKMKRSPLPINYSRADTQNP